MQTAATNIRPISSSNKHLNLEALKVHSLNAVRVALTWLRAVIQASACSSGKLCNTAIAHATYQPESAKQLRWAMPPVRVTSSLQHSAVLEYLETLSNMHRAV